MVYHYHVSVNQKVHSINKIPDNKIALHFYQKQYFHKYKHILLHIFLKIKQVNLYN